MKMKKLGYGLLMSILMVISSCTDFVDPNIPYKTFDTALYLRTIRSAPTSLTFNFFELASSKFQLTIEAVDAEGGETLESVEIRVRHRRLIPGVGFEFRPAGTASDVNDVLVKTLSRADFQQAAENPNHPTTLYKRASFEVSAAEAIAAVGLTNATVEGGDTFEFRLVATDKFGREFGWDNRSADVAGGFFYDSPFLYNVNVVCPTDLGGTYQYESTAMQSIYGSCPGTITGEVTFTPVPNSTAYTVSDATFGFWECYGDTWGNGNVRLNDSCGILSFSGSDKYGASYTFNFISNNGAELRFSWVNSDNETGTVTLFANEGKPWPPTLQ
ncbi:hypothetical protein [Shivajiella indica]|uniref:Uncharacterized protein n=1 Tax=Shivajiella indica TaxID=872115 RepID=A0ABW5B638_9BACT